MASNVHTVIVEPEHEYLNAVPAKAEHEYVNVGPEKPARVETRVQLPTPTTTVPTSVTIAGTVLFILSSVIAVIQFWIGRSYAKDCPVEPRIPRYLYISGIVGLVLAIFGLLQNVFSRAVERKSLTPKQTAIFAIPITCTACVGIVLLIFLIFWFIFGCIWVFRVWMYVQYKNPDQGTYCHPLLYRFAFGLLLASLIYMLLTSVYSSYKVPREMKRINERRTKAVKANRK